MDDEGLRVPLIRSGRAEGRLSRLSAGLFVEFTFTARVFSICCTIAYRLSVSLCRFVLSRLLSRLKRQVLVAVLVNPLIRASPRCMVRPAE